MRVLSGNRDPHVLGWLAELCAHTPPLAKITLATRVIYLHRLLEELAWTEQAVKLMSVATADEEAIGIVALRQ